MAPRKNKRSRAAEAEEEEEVEVEEESQQAAAASAKSKKGRKKKQAAAAGEDGEAAPAADEPEEDPFAPTGASRKAFDAMTANQQEQKVAEMVRYIVFRISTKTPVTYNELAENVMGKQFRPATGATLAAANKMLRDVFGMELVELPVAEARGQPPAPLNLHNTTVKGSKAFVPMSVLENQERHDVMNWSFCEEQQGLLVTVLSLIYMSNYELPEAQLWKMLNKLGVYKTKTHPTFGSVDKLLQNEFVRERYLTRIKSTDTEGVQYSYRWGPRARSEFTEESILTFVAKVQGETPEHLIDRTLQRRNKQPVLAQE